MGRKRCKAIVRPRHPAEFRDITPLVRFPTRFGMFKLMAVVDKKGDEHVVIIRGNVRDKKNVPSRIHSACLTGDVFGSMRCDCRDQLEAALKFLGKKKCGLLVYLNQEGRGIGLVNKIKAYWLQDRGLDTVEANRCLGFEDDMRNYRIAAQIIKYLGIRSVVLLTNNPEKIEDLRKNGVEVSGRKPLIAEPTPYNRRYLKTKETKMGHMLSGEWGK